MNIIFHEVFMKKFFINLLALIFLNLVPLQADAGIISAIKTLFTPRPQPKPLQVKIIPKGAACAPSAETPNPCDIKK